MNETIKNEKSGGEEKEKTKKSAGAENFRRLKFKM